MLGNVVFEENQVTGKIKTWRVLQGKRKSDLISKTLWADVYYQVWFHLGGKPELLLNINNL